MTGLTASDARAVPSHGVPFGEAMKVWARVAALSFGGPAGQIAVMHRIIVEEKKWIGEQRFLQTLNYCHLLPGPEAQQLAIYIGWLMHKTKGGLFAGTLFVLPGLIAIMALSWIYVLLGKVTIVQGLFFGLKAAVLVIVVEAVLRVGRRALRNNTMRALAAAAFIALFFYDVPFPLVVLIAGLVGYFGGRAVYWRSSPGEAMARPETTSWPTPTPFSARKRPSMPARTSAGRCPSPRCSWRCGWCRWRRSMSDRGATMSSPRSPSFSARRQWSPLAGRTPCWPTWRNRRSLPTTG